MRRTLKVAAGLAAAGGVVGAAAGMLVAAIVDATIFGVDWNLADLQLVVGVGGGLGAACGAVLAPLASFAFMRRVPFGRLFAETLVGTVVAGTAGVILLPTLPAMLGVASLGFLAAGARLAWVYRGSRRVDALPASVDA